MKMKKIILIFLASFALCLALASCAAPDIEPGGAEAVISKDGKTVTVTAVPDETLLEKYKSGKIYLFALKPGQSVNAFSDGEKLGEAPARQYVRFAFPLIENGATRLYSEFVPAFYDSGRNVYVPAVNSPVYISNPEVLASDRSEFPEKKSLKGIVSAYDADAVLSGVSHAVIDIPIEKYVTLSPQNAERYVFDGATRYFDLDAVKKLDGRVKYFSENGVNVYFRFLLSTSYNDLPEGLKYLAFPSESAGREDYAVNMTDPSCAVTVSALAGFMAERYAGADGVPAFIAGKALNAPGKSTGDADYQTAFRASTAFVRTLYNAMASNYENGRVFLTVDSSWKVSPGGNAGVSGYKFLSDFDADAKFSGNYPWGVAVATSSSSLDSDRIWYDNSGDGKYLTPSNFGALTEDYLGVENNFYDGAKRKVIVSDFSSEARDSLPENQAVSCAYAYYKAVADGNISAFVYSYQCDTDEKTAGFYKLDEDGKPREARVIRDVFTKMDSDADINYAVEKTDIGVKWTSLYGDVSKTAAVRKEVTGDASYGVDPETYDSKLLYGFDAGSDEGFTAVGDGSVASLLPSSLEAILDKKNAADVPYLSKTGLDKGALRNDRLLVTLSVSPLSDGATAGGYDVTLVLSQGNSLVYTASLERVMDAGRPTTFTFDIGPFLEHAGKEATEMKIFAAGADGSPCKLTVYEIYNAKIKSNTFLVILLVVLIAVTLTAIIVLTVVWIRKKFVVEFNFGKKEKKSKKNKSAKDFTDDGDVKVVGTAPKNEKNNRK